uniref:ADAM metallopeptidase with thrombospondin type 1 motif 15 n=1 Tax=Paramormyrops kingsleyae TaxID=1676925 RepID=A0A3B3Q7T7_9TELE|nr:A disintegrin and metalloproteinase with thrombospondin motifs 15-like isoform X2 [Paramormyrops kingsleyae]
MFIFIRKLVILDALLWVKVILSLESDICYPIRLDRQYSANHIFFSQAKEASEEPVAIKLTAFNQDFNLHLLPDSSFIASTLSLYSDTSASKAAVNPDFSRCFYSGDVNSEPDSYAAVSLCKGVQGAFGFQGFEYFIRPVQNDTDLLSGSPGRAHTIRRREKSHQSSNFTTRCPVDTPISKDVFKFLGKYKMAKEHQAGNLTKGVFKNLSRSKRFASIPRYVETLVVVDESMAEFHGDNLKHYVLTLMSVAAQLYKHPSILNAINIVIVKFIVINEADKGPKVTTNAALTLRNFCTWQKKLNKNNDKHHEYWDTAILFTRQNLCGATTCDTLGMADVGTMCDPRRSCSIIEDDGLPSAFTTAHELGHVFNMPHDNAKACEENFGQLKENHMMSPTLIKIDRNKPWSTCSATIITNFLDSGHGDCLLDVPMKPLALPDSRPGSSYSLSRQCELAFGAGSQPCPYTQHCARLWCTGRTGDQLVCQTRHFPWADGTSCGDGGVCLRGGCADEREAFRAPVDGKWGKWGVYGVCSRTCGGGVQLASRNCDNPIPANGGKYCQGTRVKYQLCNLEPCPETGRSFREEQCEAFNSINLNTNRLAPSVVWVPKYSGVSPKDKCKLICRANGTGYFYVLAPKVVDGTSCSPGLSAVCVQGRCVKAGCDGQLASDKKFDKCGVCGGDGRSCRKVSGLFTKPMHGYNLVVMLPVGASNIDIRQRGYRGLVNDDNYLAVRDSQGRYLLNGNFVVSAGERDVAVRGGPLRYSGTAATAETLRAIGPLREPLAVELLSVGKMTPPRVRYSFYLAKESKEDKVLRKEGWSLSQNSVLSSRGHQPPPSHKQALEAWSAGPWGSCSASCGNGLQKRLVRCLEPTGTCDLAWKPDATRSCGQPCPAWDVGEWSPCSRSCGKGFKRRVLRCISHTGRLLHREQCTGRKKPQELDFCTAQRC